MEPSSPSGLSWRANVEQSLVALDVAANRHEAMLEALAASSSRVEGLVGAMVNSGVAELQRVVDDARAAFAEERAIAGGAFEEVDRRLLALASAVEACSAGQADLSNRLAELASVTSNRLAELASVTAQGYVELGRRTDELAAGSVNLLGRVAALETRPPPLPQPAAAGALPTPADPWAAAAAAAASRSPGPGAGPGAGAVPPPAAWGLGPGRLCSTLGSGLLRVRVGSGMPSG